MKQQNLLTKMLLLFALVVGSVSSVWATLPNNPLWKATALSDISDGARIIIISNSTTATNIALPSTTTSSSPSKIACNVSTTDGVTTITAPTGKTLQDLAWTVSKVTSGGNTTYKFYQEGSTTVRLYLSGTSSNTALKVGDANSSNDEFVMGDLGKLLKVSTATRFVGPYDNNGNDWRTYNTEDATNYKGAELTFYVLQESSDPSSAATFSNSTPSIDFPETNTYSQEVTTATGYTGRVTYEITANTAGATIEGSTVTVTQGGSVTVKATAPAVTGFAISTASYTLTVNDTRKDTEVAISAAGLTNTEVQDGLSAGQLTATVSAGGAIVAGAAVTWTSSNPTIATIDGEGNVTLVKKGTTTITANYAGSSEYKSSSTIYELTVTDRNILVIDLNNTLFNISAGNNGTEQSTTLSNGTKITTGCTSSASSKTYYANNHIRFYADSYLILEAPKGYVITNVSLNRYNNDTWNPDKVSVAEGGGSLSGNNPLLWNGCSTKVKFSYSGQCRTSSVDVTLVKYPTVKIASSGYSTLSNDNALDFANAVADDDEADALVAYIIPSNDGVKLTKTEVTEAPAGTGILLKGTAGVTYTIPVKANATAVGTNLLKAGPVTVPDGNETIYLLKSGQFHLASAGTTSAGKAYLELPAAVGAPALSIDNDDETTGIGMTTVNGQQTTDGVYYDLSGRRVAQPTKGLYIVNGKKIVIK